MLFLIVVIATLLGSGHTECNWYSNNQFQVPVGYCLNVNLPNETISYKYVCEDSETIQMWVWNALNCPDAGAENENVNITELVNGNDFNCDGTTDVEDCAIVWRTYTEGFNPEGSCEMTDFYVESATVADVCQNAVQSNDERDDQGYDNALNQSESGWVIDLGGISENETNSVADIAGTETEDIVVASLVFECMQMVADPDSWKIDYTYYTGDDCVKDEDADEVSADFEIKDGCTGIRGDGFYTEVVYCPGMSDDGSDGDDDGEDGDDDDDDSSAFGHTPLTMPFIAMTFVLSLLYG